MLDRSVIWPRLVGALIEAVRERPLDRKILVGPRLGVSRELLRRLVREGVSWVGFEPTTPLALARLLVASRLIERELTVADEFDELSLIDGSIDAAAAEPGGDVLSPFVRGAGLRSAMANSIQAIRLAGLDAAMLGRAGFRDRRKREAIARVLASYERILFLERRVDTAGVLRLAIDELRVGSTRLPDASFYILAGQDRRGLSGALVAFLIESGAVLLDDDPVFGLAIPPAIVIGESTAASSSALARLHAVDAKTADELPVAPVQLFAAGSVSDEVREVLRRVVAGGHRWDEVEIVATDTMAYGAAIDSLARRLGIPVTYAAGLPIARTRPGRAFEAYLHWLRDDFAEDVLRDAIERGDIAPPQGGHGTTGPELARRLRRMAVGRGRERYAVALARAARHGPGADGRDDDMSAEEVAEWRAREARTLDDLTAILEPVLAATPALPDRLEPDEPIVSPADLARGLLTWLHLVPIDDAEDVGSADRTAHSRLVRRLQRLASVPLRPTTLDAAISIVAAKLDSRVPAPAASGTAPWSSAGGCLHVSDVEHGGLTGRAQLFVVGLDAVRFPGASTHDTLLGDEERKRLLRDSPYAPIPTSGERLQERRWHLARMLARQRGQVTLSYSAWEAAEARTVAPAAEMLQAWRLRSGDATADYEAMHDALDVHASAVPRGAGRLDAADVWLGALARDGVMLRGTDVVRAAFPGLDAGLRAESARDDPAFSAYVGRVAPRRVFDPRGNDDVVLSAKRLETLGTCPLRYFLRYVMRLVPPEDAAWVADRWLTPLERGRVLHSVFERALRLTRERGHDVGDDGFRAIAREALTFELARHAHNAPPPGDAVQAVETAMLQDDVDAFVQMTRRLGAPWRELELRFGQGIASHTDAVRLPTKQGDVRLSGAIDRIDEHADGLVVIDYKTGSAEGYGRHSAVFHGGRRLQHALYVAVARRIIRDRRGDAEDSVDVVRAEYHFPTHRGETRIRSFSERELRRVRGILNALLGTVASGYFHPTDTADDCRFCDYRTVCRVREENGRIASPPAEWAAQTDAPELMVMRKLRHPVL